MRICMIMSTPLPPREGIGFYVWNLSRYLMSQGHQVQIITRGDAQPLRRETVAGVTIWRAPFLPMYPVHVHLHGALVQRLVRRLEPSVDLFHLHTPLVPAVKVTAPLLVTVHTPIKADAGAIDANNMLGVLVKLQTPVSVRLERDLFARANKITAVASSVAQELAAYDIDPAEVTVLGNGVDTDAFTPGAHHQVVGGRPYFLTTGRLAPRKGLEDLLRCATIVAREYPAYRFLVAGAGPLEAELREAIRRNGLEHSVVLLGHVAERKRMAALYSGATAYIHPAHYEGLSTALLEAMACGRPVVATGVSGALDVVEHGRNGLLVRPRNPHDMAQAVMELIRYPELALKLADGARRTVQERYSWQVVGRAYADEYTGLLQGVAA
jgi:glycosyltransferase involved in cell wall biosynthesis